MNYRLWIDDNAYDPGIAAWRKPPANETDWIIATASEQALAIVKAYGVPSYISFDHDLGLLNNGESDSTILFLKSLFEMDPLAIDKIYGYDVHSQNPEGALNIYAYMDSWKRSLEL